MFPKRGAERDFWDFALPLGQGGPASRTGPARSLGVAGLRSSRGVPQPKNEINSRATPTGSSYAIRKPVAGRVRN
jgi:hypothetical protein